MISGVYGGVRWTVRPYGHRRFVMSGPPLWLTAAQFARLPPRLPTKPRGVPRVDTGGCSPGFFLCSAPA